MPLRREDARSGLPRPGSRHPQDPYPHRAARRGISCCRYRTDHRITTAGRMEVPSWIGSEKRNFLSGRRQRGEGSGYELGKDRGWEKWKTRYSGYPALSSTSRIFFTRVEGEYGFPMNDTASSNTPWWAMTFSCSPRCTAPSSRGVEEPELLGELPAVHPGHHHVGQQQRDPTLSPSLIRNAARSVRGPRGPGSRAGSERLRA